MYVCINNMYVMYVCIYYLYVYVCAPSNSVWCQTVSDTDHRDIYFSLPPADVNVHARTVHSAFGNSYHMSYTHTASRHNVSHDVPRVIFYSGKTYCTHHNCKVTFIKHIALLTHNIFIEECLPET